MKLIVGLGNPGDEYKKTRHNAGFLMLDHLINKYGYLQHKQEFQAHTFTTLVNGEKIIFAYPQTFMNRSGFSVQAIAQYYRISPEDILIIHDEKDFPIGKAQFRPGGSAGGHNGLKSIFEQFGNQNFKRLRIGIGQPIHHQPLADWVLSPFNQQDWSTLQSVLNQFSGFINDWTKPQSFTQLMNLYNNH